MSLFCLIKLSDQTTFEEWAKEWGTASASALRQEKQRWEEVRARREKFLAEKREKKREKIRNEVWNSIFHGTDATAQSSAMSTPTRGTLLDFDASVIEQLADEIGATKPDSP